MTPLQERRAEFTMDQAKEILKAGTEKAAKRAEATMDEVREAMKLNFLK